MFRWLQQPAERPPPLVWWEAQKGHHGLCDRLRGLACGLAWAGARGMQLKYAWPPNRTCPAFYDALFEQPVGICFDPSGPERAPEGAFRLTMEANLMPKRFWAHLMEDGLTTDPFSDVEAFVSAWRKEVRSFRPVASIQSQIDDCLSSVDGRPLIGIHLRRTDVVTHKSKPEITASNVALHDQIMLQEVRNHARRSPDAVFFLASDDRRLFQTWASTLDSESIPFISHDSKTWTGAFRQTPVADAVVDLWMLGHCEVVLGTVRSGFLLIARTLGARTKLLTVPGAGSLD